MKKTIQLISTSVLALALVACGGAGGTVEKGTQDSDKVEDSTKKTAQNDNINGLYKAFTTCENAVLSASEQALLTRLCGEHDITFATTGNKGVLRITGAIVNWDKFNTGMMAGQYNNWRNFYVEVFMFDDEGLEVTQHSANKYPYYFAFTYMSSQSANNAQYKIEKNSESAYLLTITEPSRNYMDGRQYSVTLDIQLGATASEDKINGSISNGLGAKVQFSASGKAKQNNPYINLK